VTLTVIPQMRLGKHGFLPSTSRTGSRVSVFPCDLRTSASVPLAVSSRWLECPCETLVAWAGTPKAEAFSVIGVYLEVTLVNGQNYSIPVEEGHSLEQELELFLEREGRYATDWVPLMKAGRELFVRYEQIVLISPMG
jgi:hypothetical protein